MKQFMRSIENTLDQLDAKITIGEQSTSAINQAKRVLSSIPGLSVIILF